MTQIEGSVLVEAPVAEVFELASDWRRWEEWFEGVSDFRSVGEVSRGSGARYAYRARLFGLPARVETEIHDFAEQKGWTGIGTKGMPHTTKWVFEERGDSTLFTYILEYQLPVPLLGPFLDRLMLQREWQRIIDKSLESLRAHFAAAER